MQFKKQKQVGIPRKKGPTILPREKIQAYCPEKILLDQDQPNFDQMNMFPTEIQSRTGQKQTKQPIKPVYALGCP